MTADDVTAVVIDPAQPSILDEVKERGLEVKYVLLTHGHFDHIGGCAALQKAGAKVGCLSGEDRLAILENLADAFGEKEIEPFTVDFTVKDGELLEICNMQFKVISTPGHTAGGVCYYIKEAGALLSGDTLFAGSYGRTDFPTSSMSDLAHSVRERLLTLPEDTLVYPGHGEGTSIGYEKLYNPLSR